MESLYLPMPPNKFIFKYWIWGKITDIPACARTCRDLKESLAGGPSRSCHVAEQAVRPEPHTCMNAGSGEHGEQYPDLIISDSCYLLNNGTGTIHSRHPWSYREPVMPRRKSLWKCPSFLAQIRPDAKTFSESLPDWAMEMDTLHVPHCETGFS